MRRRTAHALYALWLGACPLVAHAQDAEPREAQRSADPEDVGGLERRASEPGDDARRAANVVLFLPRAATELFFITTGAAAGLIEEEQVVPRIRDMIRPREGEVRIFPTAFVETGSGVNVGARVIGRAGRVATTVRAGVGGAHDLVAESRLRIAMPEPLPFALGLEALHDERSSLGYLGLGQEPESDPRNRFLATAPSTSATYSEARERFIAAAGVRMSESLELLASSSFTRRFVRRPPDASADAIADVFEPGSVPGSAGATQLVYSELSLRADTRETRGGPTSGFLLEGYAGRGDGVRTTTVHLVRSGGRIAGFFPVVARDNVLSPKLVLDGLTQLRGRMPFVELTRQPDFRGFDTRRDYVSLVGSLDYRWTLMRYLAARLFTDVATVAPEVAELDLDGLRWATGMGLDIFSRHAQLGSVLVSGSPDGVSFGLSFGVASGFGDRQHRN